VWLSIAERSFRNTTFQNADKDFLFFVVVVVVVVGVVVAMTRGISRVLSA
jgi:hypothetical protein